MAGQRLGLLLLLLLPLPRGAVQAGRQVFSAAWCWRLVAHGAASAWCSRAATGSGGSGGGGFQSARAAQRAPAARLRAAISQEGAAVRQ